VFSLRRAIKTAESVAVEIVLVGEPFCAVQGLYKGWLVREGAHNLKKRYVLATVGDMRRQKK